MGKPVIEAINHVGLRVRDPDAAAKFYVDLLGLTANPRKPNWLMLGNGQMVHLMPATGASDDGRDIGDLARHLALHVGSLETITARLLAHGYAPFQTELSAPDGGRPARRTLTDASDLTFGIGTVFVADPDGNIVEFVDPARGILAEVGGASAAGPA